MSFAVLGCGNMSISICTAIAGANTNLKIVTYDPIVKKAFSLAGKISGVSVDTISALKGNSYYLICCKPHQFADLASELAPNLNSNSVIISIMAGVSTKKIQGLLGVNKIVRTMPNTPAQVGEGVVLIYFSKEINEYERVAVSRIFGGVNLFHMDSEDLVDKVTGVSGSGPAYIFEIARILEKKLKEFGISSEDAIQISKQTIFGSSKLLLQSDQSAETLRNNVTSKGGVTETALAVLRYYKLEEAFSVALDKAYEKSKRLFF